MLDTDTTAQLRGNETLRIRVVEELLQLADADSWILRSTSPREDAPGRSAAGWFASPVSAPTPDELATAIGEVIASAQAPALIDRLGLVPEIAILAQPLLSLELWCTAELRDGSTFLEGWKQDGGATRQWTADQHPVLTPLLQAAANGLDMSPALFEAGIDAGGGVILQMRPAPMRALQRGDGSPQVDRVYPGLGLQVRPGDEGRERRLDLEHCPTPMSVLLATVFGRWIATGSSPTPDRILDGRWTTSTTPPSVLDETSAREALKLWQEHHREQTTPALRRLTVAADEIDGGPESWKHFLTTWFEFQSLYFDVPSATARAWARAVLSTAQGCLDLDDTPGSARRRRWRELHAALAAHPSPPMLTADAIARWVDANPADPVAGEILETTQRDRHISPLPYDGFTPGLDEDPWPLYRALARAGSPGRPSPVPPANQSEAAAAEILAFAEIDNESLLKAYALWRVVIRKIGHRRELPRPTDLHFLDVETFETWLASEEPIPEDAVGRGRALHAAWRSRPARTPAGESGILRGRPAAGGVARGEICRGTALLDLPDSMDPGRIAVVSTLTPADAVAVPDFGALVCETGDVLGHASVLAREYGLPCVVDVADARRHLARARRILVDGDRGEVRILD